MRYEGWQRKKIEEDGEESVTVKREESTRGEKTEPMVKGETEQRGVTRFKRRERMGRENERR